MHEGLALSICFGYDKWFLRSFMGDPDTYRPKSTRKYLFDTTTKTYSTMAIETIVIRVLLITYINSLGYIA